MVLSFVSGCYISSSILIWLSFISSDLGLSITDHGEFTWQSASIVTLTHWYCRHNVWLSEQSFVGNCSDSILSSDCQMGMESHTSASCFFFFFFFFFTQNTTTGQAIFVFCDPGYNVVTALRIAMGMLVRHWKFGFTRIPYYHLWWTSILNKSFVCMNKAEFFILGFSVHWYSVPTSDHLLLQNFSAGWTSSVSMGEENEVTSWLIVPDSGENLSFVLTGIHLNVVSHKFLL